MQCPDLLRGGHVRPLRARPRRRLPAARRARDDANLNRVAHDLSKPAIDRIDVRRRPGLVLHLGRPCLDDRGTHCRQRQGAKLLVDERDVNPGHLHGPRFARLVALKPCFAPLLDRRPGRLGVDIMARYDGAADLIEPPLRVRLPAEVPSVLPARVVPVACPPLAILAPLDASRPFRLPSSWQLPCRWLCELRCEPRWHRSHRLSARPTCSPTGLPW